MPYITKNGVRDFTPEEIAEMKAEAERLAEELKNSPPTETERLEAVEAAFLELAEALFNG